MVSLFAYTGIRNQPDLSELDLTEPPVNAFQTLAFRILSWNIESVGNDPQIIASQLINDLERYLRKSLLKTRPCTGKQS